MHQLGWLGVEYDFPDTSNALDEPNGLLAVGGDLSPERLLRGYSKGIFPWYSDEQPILWWSPSPRMILEPKKLHVGRSARKLLNKQLFSITTDTVFAQVIEHCASIERPEQDGTWITDEMRQAYLDLHKLGYAHSIEAWQGDRLVGGLYGLAMGKAFFGESMFSLVSGASKVAFIHLVHTLQKWDYKLVDCQIHTEYLASLGAQEVPREEFESLLKIAVSEPSEHTWQLTSTTNIA